MPALVHGRRHALAAALACALVACGDGPTGPRPTTLVIQPATVTIRQKESQRLQVSVTDQDDVLLSGVAVTFETSNASVVTVSNLGDVTSVGPRGNATVRVKAGGLAKEVPVVVEGVAGSVVVTPSPVVMPQKGTLPLQAKVLDIAGAELPGQSFVFQSTNPALVTVDAAGVLTSVGPHGVAKVDVRSGELLATVDVAVTQVPTTLQVTPNPLPLATGQTTKLRVRTLDAIGVDVATTEPPRFESSDPSVVTVDAEGNAQSVGPLGQATVTVRIGALSQAVPVTVTAVTHPAGDVSGTIALSGMWGVAFARTGAAYAVGMGSVQRLDLTARTATAVTTASGGLDLAISTDGTRGYVPNFNFQRVDAVDLATGATVRSSAPLTGTAFTDLLGADDQTLWVGTNAGVLVLDAATLAVQQTLNVGSVIHLARHPSQPYVYASVTNGTVVEIDATARTVRRTFTVGGAMQGVAVSRDGTELYVANEDGPVAVVNLGTGTKVAEIGTGATSFRSSGYGIALSPDGLRLYVSLTNSNKLAVIDPAARTLLGNIAIPNAPRRMAFNARGDVLLVASESGGVTIIR